MTVRALLACALLALSSGCSGGRVYEGHGVVHEVDVVNGQAVIEHDEIPGLMSAMTMRFDVPDPAVLARMSPGQHIEFDLEVTEQSYRIVAVRGAGSRSGASRAPSLASMRRERDPAPGFSLIDHEGKRVSLGDLAGEVLLVDFIFTRCSGPCPILTSRHVELQRLLSPGVRERVHFVSISLDPANDSPEALAAYARERGVDLSGWSFLTGPEAEVAEVVRSWGVGTLRAPDGNIDHAIATFLVDARGRIARRWLGLEQTAAQMRDEIAALANATPAGS